MNLRMMRRHLAAAALLGISICAGVQAHAQGYSVNAGDPPVTGTAYTTTDDGWALTPTATFGLTSVGTDFAPINGATSRTVTAVVYTGLPGHGLTAVDSGTATVTGAGGNITFTMSSYTIASGTEYFIGFENLAGLGYNFTAAGTYSAGSRYYDNGGATYNTKTASYTDPIISLNGPDIAVVPEPAPLAIVGLGLLGLAGMALATQRRRASVSLNMLAG